jgi:hypothetical protein
MHSAYGRYPCLGLHKFGFLYIEGGREKEEVDHLVLNPPWVTSYSIYCKWFFIAWKECILLLNILCIANSTWRLFTVKHCKQAHQIPIWTTVAQNLMPWVGKCPAVQIDPKMSFFIVYSISTV